MPLDPLTCEDIGEVELLHRFHLTRALLIEAIQAVYASHETECGCGYCVFYREQKTDLLKLLKDIDNGRV